LECSIRYNPQLKAQKPNCEKSILPNKTTFIQTPQLKVNFTHDAVYDVVCFQSNEYVHLKSGNTVIQFHNADVPLHKSQEVTFIPSKKIDNLYAEKIAVKRLPYNNESSTIGTKATWIDGNVKATLKEFGHYEIVIDNTAPIVKSSINNNDKITHLKQISFVITEETTSVKDAQLYAGNQWLRLVQKGNTYTYYIDDHLKPGSHTLTLTASDENNNIVKKTYTITR
jgi:hypothetical protein